MSNVQRSASRPFPEQSQPAPLLERTLLETVLRRTLADDEEVPVSGAERAALADAAQRLQGVPFCQEPVLLEMVRSMLQVECLRSWEAIELRSASRRIAQSLFEDPTARCRAEALWTRIGEGQP